MNRIQALCIVAFAIAAVIALFTNFSLYHNTNQMETGKVIELMVYQVNDDAKHNLALIDDRVTQLAQQFDGFISRKVHQSSEDSSIFMDYTAWESLQHAQYANELSCEMREFQPFYAVINEVKAYTHYHVVD